MATDESVSTGKLIEGIGSRISALTISEIAEITGKSKRTIATYLARHEIACRDYGAKTSEAHSTDGNATSTSLQSEPDEIQQTRAYSAVNADEQESAKSTVALLWPFGVLWAALSIWGFIAKGASFFLGWIALTIVIFGAHIYVSIMIDNRRMKKKRSTMSDSEWQAYKNAQNDLASQRKESLNRYITIECYGEINGSLVCPHCQTKGQVRSKSAEEVTSTKVVPVVGNTIKARKKVTQMHCDNCGTTWNV